MGVIKLFKKKESSKKNIANDWPFDLDALWMSRELEFQHQNEKFQFRANENQGVKFGEVINSLFDIRKEELSVLTINDGTLTTIERPDEIWNFDFLSYYKKDNYIRGKECCSKLSNQIVMTLGYQTYDKAKIGKDKSICKRNAMLIVHLQCPEGRLDKVIYIQTTFCIPTTQYGRRGINSQPDCLSILIAYDYRSKEENTQEFFSALTSAKEKLNTGKSEELSASERVIMEILHHPIIAQEFYFGKKALTENRYWDAIMYLGDAFKGLQQKYWEKEEKFSDQEFQTLVECSFLIGYCYYELRHFDKSYKYLEFSAHNSDSYEYQSEYINSLIALHDIRVLTIIDHRLNSLTRKKEEERTENDYKFYMFLLRRKAYCMIELQEYDKAENILKHILEDDPNNQFAKQEIEYIQRMRKNE